MAGIAAAKEPHTAGKQFIIIEGTDRVGGRIKTGTIGSSDIEQGASWIHGARVRGGGGNNPIWDLAAHGSFDWKASSPSGVNTDLPCAPIPSPAVEHRLRLLRLPGLERLLEDRLAIQAGVFLRDLGHL